jgi:ABC-type nitrate/sulfonate/bicarbonate transport system ATPase subunit
LSDARPAGDSGRLEVRIVRKAFVAASGEHVEVLRDVTFGLDRGLIGVLVGPSGCGKTTMLRIIAGLDTDYQGTVVRPAAGRLGMVFQEPRLLPWRTVEDNVRLVAPAADPAKLEALFHVLELTHHRSHYPGELSLGLARRVALARALAVAPDILLLDEPFVSLDDALAARLRDELVTLVGNRALTTLMVTHDVDEAVRVADRVILLSARPAGILVEVPILTPRAARMEGDIASIKAEIARQFGAVAEMPSNVTSDAKRRQR